MKINAFDSITTASTFSAVVVLLTSAVIASSITAFSAEKFH
jgi:hypothetical protein